MNKMTSVGKLMKTSRRQTSIGKQPVRAAAVTLSAAAAFGLLATPTAAVGAPPIACPRDSVLVGTACVDKYEASVWRIPAGNTTLIAKIKAGTVTRTQLEAGGFP